MHKSILLVLLLPVMACGPSKKTVSGLNQQRDSSKKGTYAHLLNTAYQPLLNQSTFQLDSISQDDTYGYTIANPVMVGKEGETGPYNEQRFLNALLGPAGETVSYNRQGSCCAFATPNGMMGGGLLDRYEVKIEGDSKPYILYLNMYDKGVLKAPKGFTFKK